MNSILARATKNGFGTSEFFAVVFAPVITALLAYLVGHHLLNSDQAVGVGTAAVSLASAGAAALYARGRAQIKVALVQSAAALPAAPVVATAATMVAKPD